ncbi:hypothetical protein HK102_003298, partial [Quaeritorhiza haematococci]
MVGFQEVLGLALAVLAATAEVASAAVSSRSCQACTSLAQTLQLRLDISGKRDHVIT